MEQSETKSVKYSVKQLLSYQAMYCNVQSNVKQLLSCQRITTPSKFNNDVFWQNVFARINRKSPNPWVPKHVNKSIHDQAKHISKFRHSPHGLIGHLNCLSKSNFESIASSITTIVNASFKRQPPPEYDPPSVKRQSPPAHDPSALKRQPPPVYDPHLHKRQPTAPKWIQIIFRHALPSITYYCFSNPYTNKTTYNCLYSKLCSVIIANQQLPLVRQSLASRITQHVQDLLVQSQGLVDSNFDSPYTLYAVMILIASLYKHSIIDIEFLKHHVWEPRLNQPKEQVHAHTVIALCILLRHCGSKMDGPYQSSTVVSAYLQLLTIASKRHEFRVRCQTEALVEMRRNAWKTRYQLQERQMAAVVRYCEPTPKQKNNNRNLSRTNSHYDKSMIIECPKSKAVNSVLALDVPTFQKHFQSHLDNGNPYYCELCNVTCTAGLKSFEGHLKGKKHKKKAKKELAAYNVAKVLNKSETEAKECSKSIAKVDVHYAEGDLCRNKFEDWLCNVVRLDRYRTVFQDNGYDDITMIPFMDEDVIQDELGISNKLHCKLILKRIDEFKAMVCEFDAFLDANVALKHYEDNLKERGIITMMHLKEDIQHKKDISRIVGIKQKANVQKIWNIIYGPCVSDAEEEPDKKTLNVELAHKQIMHIRNRIAQRSGPPHSMQSGPQSASMYAGSASIPHPSGLTGSAPMVGTGAVAPQPHQSSVATGQSSAPMLEVNPLTAEMLQDAKPAEKKRLIAERLFAKIQVVEPCLAGKITGMLLEMDNTELLVLLTEQRALMNKINEALAVLKDHQQKQLLQNPGSTKCFYK
eukprot:185839_1